jgi:hypothetical protein
MPRLARPAAVAQACLAAAVVLGVALATHLPYAAATACENADAAVVTLMGRHFAHGELAVYFWAQRYMGALEPAAVALLQLPAGGNLGIAASALVAYALLAVQLFATARIARRLGGSTLVALVVAAGGSAITAYAETVFSGARLAGSAFAVLALDTIQGGRGRARAVLAGALFGLAFYGDHLMVVWALPIAFEAYRRRSVFAAGIGAFPLFLFDRFFYAISRGPKPGIADPWDWPRNAKLLVADALPMFFGADWLARPQHHFDPPEPDAIWVVTSLATLGFAIAVAVWIARSARRVPSAAAIAVVPAVCAALFLLGGADIMSTRYLPPVWPAVAIAAGVVAAARPVTGAIGAAVTALNMVLSVHADTLHKHGAEAGQECRDEKDEVAARIRAAGVQGVWADYWDAYPLALWMDESVPFAPFAGMDRYPAWTDRVRQAHPVAYLLSDADRPPPPALRAELEAATTPVRFGRFQMYVLPESLAPLPPSP